jgi:hypothetical protein
MFELLLVSLFVSFIYVSIESFLDMMGMFVNMLLINFIVSLSLSGLGFYLLSEPFGKVFVVKIAAGAFLGMVNIKVVERLYTFRTAIVNPTRQQ